MPTIGHSYRNTAWPGIELALLLVLSCVYLVVFWPQVPHGDALRIVRQIDAQDLIWNPNHLLLDPFGYALHGLLNDLGLVVAPMQLFATIAAVATVVSIALFHIVLMQAGIGNAVIRITALCGLFASRNFLSMAVTQYYFMVQMPFLLGALWCLVRFVVHPEGHRRELYLAGVLLAVATTIEINNLLVVLVLGLLLAMFGGRIRWGAVTRLWSGAALIGFPVYIAGYILSGASAGFFSWLTAYQGQSGDALDQFYGLEMSLKGWITSFVRVLFNLFSGNLVETAGLGTVAWETFTQPEREYLINPVSTLLGVAALPLVGAMMLWLLYASFRAVRGGLLVILLLGWILAYIAFAFFWNNGSDIFWFQTLPAIWLLVALHLAHLRGTAGCHMVSVEEKPERFRIVALGMVAAMLLVLNTLQLVVPIARADLDEMARAHDSMLATDDIEIIPGWDEYKWMIGSGDGPEVRKLLLMNMALASQNSEEHISRLPEIVDDQLRKGGRVIVGRLYDLDYGINPWGGLRQMGWPRRRIQESLSGFCNREIARIDGVVFREVHACDE